VPGAAGADDPCLRRRHLPLEAGTELIIAGGDIPAPRGLHQSVHRTRHHQWHPIAPIDWDAATAALATGGIPCSGGERVTDENAPITFLEPDHPLLNTPNKMGQDDFKDWIQERGLYYPREWDPQFHALLQSNDPGEGPLKGGLLVAEYGIGTDDDEQRARYLVEGLAQLRAAQDRGVDVRGFFHWTGVDNYEWLHGFDVAFGIIDRDRDVKPSALVLQREARR